MFDAYELNSKNQYALPQEIAYLEDVGRFINGKQVVMIGAGPGVLGLAALRYYQATQKSPPMFTVIDNDTTQWIEAHFSAAGIPQNRVRYWHMDSADAGSKWQHGPIGLLIVDGDHSQYGVMRDLFAWLPHLDRKTVIFFHDYLEREGGFNGVGEWRKGGVAAAVEHHAASLRVVDELGISLVCRLR